MCGEGDILARGHKADTTRDSRGVVRIRQGLLDLSTTKDIFNVRYIAKPRGTRSEQRGALVCLRLACPSCSAFSRLRDVSQTSLILKEEYRPIETRDGSTYTRTGNTSGEVFIDRLRWRSIRSFRSSPSTGSVALAASCGAWCYRPPLWQTSPSCGRKSRSAGRPAVSVWASAAWE